MRNLLLSETVTTQEPAVGPKETLSGHTMNLIRLILQIRSGEVPFPVAATPKKSLQPPFLSTLQGHFFPTPWRGTADTPEDPLEVYPTSTSSSERHCGYLKKLVTDASEKPGNLRKDAAGCQIGLKRTIRIGLYCEKRIIIFGVRN